MVSGILCPDPWHAVDFGLSSYTQISLHFGQARGREFGCRYLPWVAAFIFLADIPQPNQ
jgi:hypothetical protein